MKILIVGGNGTIGKHVAEHFKKNEEVIIAGRSSGDFLVDIESSNSIERLFKKTEKLDAIVNVAGEAKWDYFSNLKEEDYYVGIKSKLMGQVNLARIGKSYLNTNGSITLTTGILADDPVEKTASAAMVNGAIHSFVKAASLDLKFGIRLNAVSAGTVDAAFEKYREFFPGHNPVPMAKVVNGYVRSVLGKNNGQVIRIYE
ncbi:short chain dehydrogenase [Allomuricauda sp. d1]|uniref:short chain dehydrogenase n=1 Tax=Allomuricauda sp. d1 TaxID=3136725 RepID=UPI0031D61A6B